MSLRLPIVGLFVGLISNGIGVSAELVAAHKKAKGSRSVSPGPSTSQGPSLALPETATIVVSDKEKVRSASRSRLLRDCCKLFLPTFPCPLMAILTATKSEKSANYPADDEPPQYEEVVAEEDLLWDLDAAASNEETARSSTERGLSGDTTIPTLAASILAKCSRQSHGQTHLRHPVIIPQRRPGQNARGFIRAYAPSLEPHGISLDAFLTFLKNFDRAAAVSPVMNVVFLSEPTVGMTPKAACRITTPVLQTAVGAAMELQHHQRTWTFLDEVNAKVLRPRGLCALIVCYRQDGDRLVSAEQVDFNQLIQQRLQRQPGRRRDVSRRLHNGSTVANFEMPEAAPLVLPQLDQMAHSSGGEKAGKMKVMSKAMGDYYDRRAQAINVSSNCLSVIFRSSTNIQYAGISRPTIKRWTTRKTAIRLSLLRSKPPGQQR